jgi:hypothetical protein
MSYWDSSALPRRRNKENICKPFDRLYRILENNSVNLGAPPGPAVKLECCIEPFAVCEKARSAGLFCPATFDAHGQSRDRRFAIPINVIRRQC